MGNRKKPYCECLTIQAAKATIIVRFSSLSPLDIHYQEQIPSNHIPLDNKGSVMTVQASGCCSCCTATTVICHDDGCFGNQRSPCLLLFNVLFLLTSGRAKAASVLLPRLHCVVCREDTRRLTRCLCVVDLRWLSTSTPPRSPATT